MTDDVQVQFTTEQVARRHGISASTLRRWRVDGVGPPFRRISRNVVLYDRADLDDFFMSHRKVRSTTEEASP